MRTIDFMIIRLFLPAFLVALLFFCTILELADIFTNLVRYLNMDVNVMDIIKVQIYYFPKTISYSLPIAVLFAISYTLGNLYSNNELISVFGAGISLFRLIVPFVLFGFLFSAMSFWFEENVVIDSFEMKNELSRQLLNQRTSFSNTDVTVLGTNNRVVYHADYYNDSNKTLRGVLIFERDENGKFKRRIDVETAAWNGTAWELKSGRSFFWNNSLESPDRNPVMTEEWIDSQVYPEFDMPPETFQSTTRNVEEMKIDEAKQWIASVRKAGLPVRSALTEFYKRFAFALTPLIVAFISSSIGGRFKKNILLMSLLLSLVLSVVYYVTQMVSVILAKLDYIPPLTGAWAATFLFLFIGIALFRTART